MRGKEALEYEMRFWPWTKGSSRTAAVMSPLKKVMGVTRSFLLGAVRNGLCSEGVRSAGAPVLAGVGRGTAARKAACCEALSALKRARRSSTALIDKGNEQAPTTGLLLSDNKLQ